MTRADTIAALTFAVLMLSGCTGQSESQPSDLSETDDATSALDRIAESGTLRVCTTGDYRPFTYKPDDDADYTGIDIDMTSEMADALGVSVEYVDTTWETLIDDFTAGDCDIAAGGISVTAERALDVYYSEAYIQDGKTPITRCEHVDEYQTVSDINQPSVRAVVNPGGTNEEFLEQQLPDATRFSHDDNNTIFEQIIEGNADVMVTDASETKLQANLHDGVLCAVHPDDPFTFSEKAYLLPQGDEVFKEWVDQWLHIATHDGTYDKFAAEWFRN